MPNISYTIEFDKNVKTEEKEYPWIGVYKSSKIVVLFTAPQCGICLSDEGSPWRQGKYYGDDYWAEYSFVPFKGKVTIDTTL
jgi:hypothetical protein